MPNKHIPQRMCTACNEMRNKKDLIRIVKAKSIEGSSKITIDKTFKASGRGAYLCKNFDCLRKIRKSKRIDRIFSSKVPDEIYEKLEEVIRIEQQ